MDMKRRGFILAVAMVLVMGLSACKGDEKKEEETPAAVEQTEDEAEDAQEIPEKEEAEPGDEVEASEDGMTEPDSNLDNFDADMGEAAEFAALIKEAVAEKDLGKLAELTGFPVYVGLDEIGVVETKEAFLALDPDEVFSEGMQSSIEKADVEDLAASMAGFTLMDYDAEGSASITFGVVNGGFEITGINYGW